MLAVMPQRKYQKGNGSKTSEAGKASQDREEQGAAEDEERAEEEEGNWDEYEEFTLEEEAFEARYGEATHARGLSSHEEAALKVKEYAARRDSEVARARALTPYEEVEL